MEEICPLCAGDSREREHVEKKKPLECMEMREREKGNHPCVSEPSLPATPVRLQPWEWPMLDAPAQASPRSVILPHSDLGSLLLWPS